MAAAITFDNKATGSVAGATAGSTASFTVGNNVNRILVVQCYWNTGSAQTITVTYNGVSLTADKTASVTTISAFVGHLLAPATGANNINITGSADGGTIYYTAFSYWNAQQSAQPDASALDVAQTTTTPTKSLTTVAANAVVVGTFWNNANGLGTPAGNVYTNNTQTSTQLASGDSGALGAGATATLSSSGGSGSIEGLGLFSIIPGPVNFSVSDTVTGTDGTVTMIRGAIFSILDTITGTDAINAVRGAIFSVLDTITGTDSIPTFIFKWMRQAKDSSTFTDGSKHSASWTDGTKHSSSQTDQTKH